MSTKIIEKIQKLLSLSESSNENEARVAMLKAQELLAKHKLSIQEVKDIEVINSKIKYHKSSTTFTKAKWKGRLASIIAENFGCYMYFSSCRTNTIVFFGREEDIIVCNLVFEYALDCISSSVKRIQNKYKKDGLSVKGLENDYALGFIRGLTKQFDEQKKNNQEWGLVLVKDEEVVNAFENIKFDGKVKAELKFSGHAEVALMGEEEGKKFRISDRISREDEEVLIVN
jgi:hypothetical protein